MGCLGAAVLALSLDGLGRLLLAGIELRRRELTVLALSAFAGLYAYAGTALAMDGARDPRVAVGAKTFTEQYILGEILARHITQTTGVATNIKASLGSSVAFDALLTDSADVYVIGAFSTDGHIAAYDLVTLADERRAMPPYDAIVLTGPRLAARHPEVVASLRSLAGSIHDEQMRQMNLAVDIQRRSPLEIGLEFVRGWSAAKGGASAP